MKSVLTILLFVVGASASASEITKYDQAYLACIDYAHQPVSAEKDKSCRADAKAQVLSSQEAEAQFLACVDYYHGQVSEAREEACLKEIK